MAVFPALFQHSSMIIQFQIIQERWNSKRSQFGCLWNSTDAPRRQTKQDLYTSVKGGKCLALCKNVCPKHWQSGQWKTCFPLPFPTTSRSFFLKITRCPSYRNSHRFYHHSASLHDEALLPTEPHSHCASACILTNYVLMQSDFSGFRWWHLAIILD